MTSPTDKIDIIVGKFPVHIQLYTINGVRTLVMSEGQTFSNAVRMVRSVLPGVTLEAAERMIREQCPEFRDFDDLLGLTKTPPPSVERPPSIPADAVVTEPPTRKRLRHVVLVAALLPALAASWALGRYTNVADTAPAGRETASVAEDAPFHDQKFRHFAGAGSIDCEPTSRLEATCTDADGKVMDVKAATGPDGTLFRFSYGREQLGLWSFNDADYAQTWGQQGSTRSLYPNLQIHGRYGLWGTDPVRINEYGALLG